MDEEHAEYNILLTVQRHTFDDFYRKILLRFAMLFKNI